MTGIKSFRLRLLWVFVAACVVPLAFALYTDHAWEDYYITYRASKNLATGHGLVFNLGDRLQTFTSPLGVLLPALASLLTFNSSDAAALWIFRGMCIGAFGAAATLLFAATRRLGYPIVVSVCLFGWLVTDAKSVDFSINGMETAFMLAFFAYMFWATFSPAPRRWLHLGLAWAGLMWTRPDSFIYIALFSAGTWLFNDPLRTGATRREWLGIFLRAGAVCTAVYLPWFVFAWGYYGSPVPQTVVAKALPSGPKTLAGFFKFLLDLPANFHKPGNTWAAVFLPSYAQFGGWPAVFGIGARCVSVLCSLVWIVPRFRTEARAASLSFLGANLYLNYFPTFPAPWYQCLPAWLAFVTLGGILAQLFAATPVLGRRRAMIFTRVVCVSFALATLGAAGWLTLASARQLKAQQALIETGTRRKIGEWLRVHADPHDAVFLEPLGYIGFFSQLKTYDYPGLSSREVTACIRRQGPGWAGLIVAQRPRWAVLRLSEIAAILQAAPGLLGDAYEPVIEFNVRAAVLKLDVRGRAYLEFDSAFIVFRLRS